MEVVFAAFPIWKKPTKSSTNQNSRQEEHGKDIELPNDQSNSDRIHAMHTRIFGVWQMPIAEADPTATTNRIKNANV